MVLLQDELVSVMAGRDSLIRVDETQLIYEMFFADGTLTRPRSLNMVAAFLNN